MTGRVFDPVEAEPVIAETARVAALDHRAAGIIVETLAHRADAPDLAGGNRGEVDIDQPALAARQGKSLAGDFGVTPVLVDSSFAIAAAILAEATLSYLGLGPANQASWGRLLSDATNQVGAFVWWLAIFPGLAIFLTVLSYNLIGEAFRDAIDPKLKKARV